jgi:hypothetical protein
MGWLNRNINITGSMQEPDEPYFFVPDQGSNWQDLLF